MAARQLARREPHRRPGSALRRLGKGTTLACAPRLDPNRLWGFACDFIYEGISMTIGGLARAAGVHVETVRYYQRQRLLRTPQRPTGGIRRYSDSDLARLRFIRRAKELGFSLRGIRGLLQLDERDCDDVHRLASQKLTEVRNRIAGLESMAAALVDMINQCETSTRTACPIIDSLKKP